MKNFSEALAIKPNLKLTINLVLTPVGENIPCWVSVNNETVFDQNISSVQTITGDIDLLDPIDIRIKIQREHPQAIQLMLVVDGWEVLPKYQHHATPSTDYIDTDEEWSLSIPEFYAWFHKITGQGDIF